MHVLVMRLCMISYFDSLGLSASLSSYVRGALSDTVVTVTLKTVPRLFACQHCILILVNN